MWLHPSRPAEEEPGEEYSGKDSKLQVHLLQQFSAGLVRDLAADFGSVDLAIQPTGLVGTLSLGPCCL